jgi:hypothetical protein
MMLHSLGGGFQHSGGIYCLHPEGRITQHHFHYHGNLISKEVKLLGLPFVLKPDALMTF